MRISTSSWATTDADVDRSVAAMIQIAARYSGKYPRPRTRLEFMFPNAYDKYTLALQSLHIAPVAFFVQRKLQCPKAASGLWNVATLSAMVPETAVHEKRESPLGKIKIRFRNQI